MARRKKRRKVAATQATIQTRPPFLKLALSSGLALVLFIAMGASAQSLLKGNVTKQNETKPNNDLVDKYGDAANDPAVADVLRKAQGSLTTEEIKQKNEAYDALQNGEFKPGADPMMAVMSGYVPPNMSPQQAQILSRVLPKMPRMPHPPTPDDIARMAGETDNQGTALEPSEPYIAYPESFAKAHGLPTSRKLQPLPGQSFPGQLAGMPNVPGFSNLPGLSMMGIPGTGSGFGLSEAEIRTQNQRIAEECIRGRFGPINVGQLQPGHGAIAAQAKKNADTKHIAESDHQSVVGVCDDSGNEITSIQYDPWGNHSVLSGGTVMPTFMYKGMYYHDRSNLYLTLARPYSPKLGRWLSRDPIDDSYTFCLNDPINYEDPLGLYAIATYSIGTHTLTVTDSTTGQQVYSSNNFFSGNGRDANNIGSQYVPNQGPLPTGPYLIGNRTPVDRTEHHLGPQGNNNWFKLYGKDPKNGGYRWSSHPVAKGADGKWINRGEFWLHPGRASDGCMTNIADQSRAQNPGGYPNSSDFNNLSNTLQNLGTSAPYVYNGSNYVGTLQVVP